MLLAGMTSTLIQCQIPQGRINQWALSQNHINGSYLQLASGVIIHFSCLSSLPPPQDRCSAGLAKEKARWHASAAPPLEPRGKHLNYEILAWPRAERCPVGSGRQGNLHLFLRPPLNLREWKAHPWPRTQMSAVFHVQIEGRNAPMATGHSSDLHDANK